MRNRYWVGFFSHKRGRINGSSYYNLESWIRTTEFLAIHDSTFHPGDKNTNFVYLYTTEFKIIAKFSTSDLKRNWNVSTIKAGPDLMERLKSEFDKERELLDKTINIYKKGKDSEIRQGSNLYASSFSRDHDEDFDDSRDFYDDSDITSIESDYKRKSPYRHILHDFVPSINTISYFTKFVEILNEENADYPRYLEDTGRDECPDYFEPDDHDLARQEKASEFSDDAESFSRSSEDGWFYED